jgi:hypothetical protein
MTEPELWQKVDGYSVGVYDWMIFRGENDNEEPLWFDDEGEARAAFAAITEGQR